MPAAIVTGSSRGIGRAVALRFAAARLVAGAVGAFDVTEAALSHRHEPSADPSVTNVSSVLAHAGAHMR